MSDKQTTAPYRSPIVKGVTLNPPGPGTWIGKIWRNKICDILNAFLTQSFMCIISSDDGSPSQIINADVQISPGSCVTTLDLSGVLSGGGGGSSLELTDGTTDLTAVSKITVTGAVVGGTAAAATLAIAGIQQFKIVASGTIDGGDYYNCKTWDGTTLGSTVVKVAKQYKMRSVNGPASDSIRGVARTYTYAINTPYDEYKRSTSGSDGSASTDYCTPPALAGDIIIAAPFSTATPATLSSVAWIELTERKWATGP